VRQKIDLGFLLPTLPRVILFPGLLPAAQGEAPSGASQGVAHPTDSQRKL